MTSVYNLEKNGRRTSPDSTIRRLWSIYARFGMYRCVMGLRERIAYRVRGQLVCHIVGLHSCGAGLRVGKRVVLSNPRITLGDSVTLDSDSALLGTGVIDIGDNAVLNRGTEVDAALRISIGARTLVGPYCYFVDSNHLAPAPGLPLKSEARAVARINVGSDVWLGKGVIVLAGVTIGDGALVGAGSVVTSSIPSAEVWAGVPARRVHSAAERVCPHLSSTGEARGYEKPRAQQPHPQRLEETERH